MRADIAGFFKRPWSTVSASWSTFGNFVPPPAWWAAAVAGTALVFTLHEVPWSTEILAVLFVLCAIAFAGLMAASWLTEHASTRDYVRSRRVRLLSLSAGLWLLGWHSAAATMLLAGWLAAQRIFGATTVGLFLSLLASITLAYVAVGFFRARWTARAALVALMPPPLSQPGWQHSALSTRTDLREQEARDRALRLQPTLAVPVLTALDDLGASNAGQLPPLAQRPGLSWSREPIMRLIGLGTPIAAAVPFAIVIVLAFSSDWNMDELAERLGLPPVTPAASSPQSQEQGKPDPSNKSRPQETGESGVRDNGPQASQGGNSQGQGQGQTGQGSQPQSPQQPNQGSNAQGQNQPGQGGGSQSQSQSGHSGSSQAPQQANQGGSGQGQNQPGQSGNSQGQNQSGQGGNSQAPQQANQGSSAQGQGQPGQGGNSQAPKQANQGGSSQAQNQSGQGGNSQAPQQANQGGSAQGQNQQGQSGNSQAPQQANQGGSSQAQNQSGQGGNSQAPKQANQGGSAQGQNQQGQSGNSQAPQQANQGSNSQGQNQPGQSGNSQAPQQANQGGSGQGQNQSGQSGNSQGQNQSGQGGNSQAPQQANQDSSAQGQNQQGQSGNPQAPQQANQGVGSQGKSRFGQGSNRRARSSLDVTRDFTRAAGGGVDPTGITVEEVGNDLWLSLPKGRLIALSIDGTVRLLLDDVQEIVRKRSRQWALTKSGLRLYRNGAFLTAATTARQIFAPHKVGAISLDRDGFAVALGDDLTILREQDQGRRTAPQADTLLTATKPTPPLAQGTRPLQQGRIGQTDGWWFRDAHEVFFIGREPCPSASSGAPAGNCKLLSYKLPTSDAEVREITADPSPVFYLAINGVTEAFAAPTEGAPLEKVARPAPQSPQEARRAISNNLQAFVRSIIHGVLDPGTLQQSGTQVSIQYGAFTLRLSGRTAGTAVEPLRRPWLEWLVTTRQFRLFTQDGSAVEVAAGDLFSSNGFAPTLPGAVLAASLKEIVVANTHGLWTRSLTDDLVERGPRWTRFDRSLPPVAAATGGRFYFDRDSVAIEGRILEPDSGTLDVQRDALRFSASVRQASVTAQLMVDGRLVDDFAATGFLHDHRLGIGIDAGVAVVLTPVGVLRLTDFRDIRPLPGRAESSALFAKGDELHARVDGGSVVRWTQAGWVAVDDPRRSGTLHGDANWRWGRVNDEVILSGAKWRVGRRGWRFDSDAVIGAAWGSDGIALVTEDGTRTAQRFGDLADFRPAEAPTPTTTGEGVVEARFLAPGTPVLGYADRSGFNVTWNAAQKAWHPMAPAQNPGVRRVAVAGDFLNIAFTQMRPTVELAADHATKGKTLVPVTWRAQQAFPFDVARAIGTDGQRLFIATLTTLQVADTADGPLRMIDTRPNATGPPAPITRIGRPASNPQRFVGISEASACFDLSDALPRPCTEPDTLVERSLGTTDFWRWTLRDRAMVRYLDATGSVVGPTVQSIGGQGFPHDQLNAYVQCGRGLALWADGTLATEVSGPHLAMAPRTTVPLPTGARTLHCQETVSMPGGTQQQIAPGLYALAGAAAWRMSGQQWTNVSELAAALNERAAGLLPYERSQLRLRRVAGTQSSVASGGPLRLEYRTLANTWQSIEAEGARYAIDSRLGLLVADGKVWSVTPKGLLRLAWSGNELALDPDEVRLTILPTIGRQRCLVDRIEQSDGTGIALPMKHGKPIILRCQNGSVFASTQFGQSDDGSFQPHRDDPFVARTLIGDPTSPLQWGIVDRVAGSYGRLRLEWRGEAVPLNNGRFQADAFVGIASFEENILDLVAENGWTRTRESALSLASADRPAGSKNIAPFVRSAVRDRDSTGANVLCLRGEQTTNRQAFRDLYRADGTWEQNVSCGRFDATEGLWTYRVQPSANGIPRLDIRGRDADGIEFARPFVDGRFGDLVATGAPLAGTGSGSLSFFVPTAAGLTTLLQGGGFAGPIRRPTTAGEVALLALRDGSPAIVTRSGITSLDRKPSIECPGAPLLLDALGERARFITMSVTREGRIEAVANREGSRVMIEGPCTGAVPAAAWLTTIELASRQRLQALGAVWKGPRAVSLAARDGRLVALRSGGLPAETPLLDQTGAPLRLLHDGSAAFLLTDSEIFRIDIDRLISLLAEHGG